MCRRTFYKEDCPAYIVFVPTQEADMIAAPISRQIHREKYMDFAEVPFYLEFTTVAIREPDPDDNTVGLFFQPFKLEVWVFILVVIPISGVALLLYVRAYRVALPQRQKETRLHNAMDALWYSVGAMLQQGKTLVHKKQWRTPQTSY